MPVTEREWRIYKRAGAWDDVIEGPDTDGLTVVPALKVERLRAVLAERDEQIATLNAALHRIHRGDPLPHKIAAEALTDA